MKIEKRHYQIEAINKTIDLIKRKESTGLLEMATGTGKTITSALIIKEFEAEFGYKKHVFIVPKNTILTNILRDYEAVFPEKKIGQLNTDRKDYEFDILITTFQSLSLDRNIEKFGTERFGLFIIDEAHLSDNNSYEKIKGNYNFDFALNLTATPFLKRSDKSFIEKMTGGNLIYKLGIFESIRNGYLSKVKYDVYLDMVDGDEIEEYIRKLNSENEYTEASISNYVNSKQRIDFIARKIKKEKILEKNKNFLVYCSNISQIENTVKSWKKELGLTEIDYGIIVGKTKYSEREKLFKLFEEGKLKIIFSVKTLTEGVDIRGAEAIINLAPTKSKSLFFQKIGRIIRKAEGKEFGNVYDFIFDVRMKKKIGQWLHELYDGEVISNPRMVGNGGHGQYGQANGELFDFEGVTINFEKDFIDMIFKESEEYEKDDILKEISELTMGFPISLEAYKGIKEKKISELTVIKKFGSWTNFTKEFLSFNKG